MRLKSVSLLAGVASLVVWGGRLASVEAQASSIGIYAAGSGSAFLPYAEGLAAYLSSKGIATDVRQTAGSIENIKRLRFDPHAMATVFMGSAFEAYTGTGAWTEGDKDFSEADAYRITHEVLSASDPRIDLDPTANGTRADRASVNTFLPFHPGAIRYYRERGITLTTRDL